MDRDFEEFFSDAYPAAVGTALRLLGSWPEAEDAAAEAFARCLVRWRRVGRLPYRKAWVLRVTTNIAIDQLRRASRLPEGVGAPQQSVEDVVLDRLVAAQVVLGLPRRQREVVMLRHYAGLTELEVAAALGIAASSVKTHLERGMGRLRGVARSEA